MGTRTVKTTEKFDIEERNGDPIAVGIKGYLEQGDPLPENLAEYEIQVKVQQLDRRGRIVQGITHNSTSLPTLFDEILDELGPGRYNVWVEYKPIGTQKKASLVKVTDIIVADPDQPAAQPGAPGAQLDPGDRRDVLQIMLAQMQQTTQMMMASQSDMTKVLIALIGNGQKAGSSTTDILNAIRTGADLAGGGEEGDADPEEGDEVGRLIKLGADVVKLIANKKDDENVSAGELKKIANASGIDENLQKQGFERQQ
jgi:hypothetical protein